MDQRNGTNVGGVYVGDSKLKCPMWTIVNSTITSLQGAYYIIISFTNKPKSCMAFQNIWDAINCSYLV